MTSTAFTDISETPLEDRVKHLNDDKEAAAETLEPGFISFAPEQIRIAESLAVLRAQVNRRAPHRRKDSDGWIGDEKHRKRDSDHNAHVEDGDFGVVTALDITHDPQNGCDANFIAECIRQSQDLRVKYVIWNQQIFSSYPYGGAPPWTQRRYRGSNAHTKHVHISVRSEKSAYDSREEWYLPT